MILYSVASPPLTLPTYPFSDYIMCIAGCFVRRHLEVTLSTWLPMPALRGTRTYKRYFYSALCSLPGRTQDSTVCRRCHRESETLAHILGFCPFEELFRNSLHHGIRSLITEDRRSINFCVYEEVLCLATGENTRRIDMLVIPPNSSVAYISDPTIRFEKFKGKPVAVNEENKKVYLPAVPFFKEQIWPYRYRSNRFSGWDSRNYSASFRHCWSEKRENKGYGSVQEKVSSFQKKKKNIDHYM